MEYDIEITNTGTKYYYKKGKRFLHREDGPAVEYANGDKSWYINGKRNRLDGPAIQYIVSEEWWVNGKRHRTDGPAVQDSYGEEWWINGKRHREDGPAILLRDGYKEWWIYGTPLSPEKENILNKWWDNKNGI